MTGDGDETDADLGRVDLEVIDRRVIDEFLAHPLGPHSAAAQRLSWILRARHDNGRIVLFEQAAGTRWQVVRIGPARGVIAEHYGTFTDLREAERAVMALRWHDRTGRDLVTRSTGGL